MFPAGHIILRGSCENLNSSGDTRRISPDQKSLWSSHKAKLKQGNYAKKAHKKDNKMILWFEVDDTGCGMHLRTDRIKLHGKKLYHSSFFSYFTGIDASKWESVFESFEQADPSTTRT